MATTVDVLKITFYDSEMQTITHSFKYADPQVDSEDVKTFANTIIANKEIYARAPQSIKSAKIITTTTDEIDLT